jgi:signal transduction histidine kinase
MEAHGVMEAHAVMDAQQAIAKCAEKPLILIVDDNPANIKVLFDLLDVAGYRTLIARDGQNAIDKLSAVTPELILLDVMMPGIDGFETCRQIKANPATAAVPVIFMTALSETDDKMQGFQCGAVDYITKPLQHDEVLARIKIHLELAQLRQHLEARVVDRTAALTQANQQLRQAQQAIEQSQLQLLQQEKMSALGNLVAGVAHEINNPINCIHGNLPFAQTYLQKIFQLLDCYALSIPEPGAAVIEMIEAIELDYIRRDFPKLLASMDESAARVTEIGQSLRQFTRTGGTDKTPVDLCEGLESTLMILQHRLKANEQRPAIVVVRDYGEVPLIEGYAGKLNQVLMNLLANAIDVLDETATQENPGVIQIAIRQAAQCLNITIHDNGPGIPTAIQAQIFDYLFTTKPAGQGTGLGLTISREIIVEQHSGELNLTSSPETGTTFTIVLPLR